jgi:hypothetical protein
MEKPTRRAFIKKSALLAAVPTVLISEDAKKNNMLVHHVFFYLKDNTESNRAKLIEGLQKLTKIKQIKAYNIGVPASTSRDVVVNDYSISWLTYFKDEASEEIYQKEPIHLKFVKDYAHLWSNVKVYDSVAVIFKN